ncbi:TetR/AcrR family transcriptional regulator [Priestia filamentosa]|uniref:TetR family transcriptional regulator n=1 Tax=Priestia filamentosa TaxID=1402861 RepID=A0A1X7E148_9BACI|nr:TetR/AcrR family transcriptional regulator [Priestia filamentosa]AKO92253.1 TetR family transcriptional regulator [Priestia filamentosa]MDT3762285.1 TetR/AcrR family transcriptional regulator [Priestia filamentosa]OXS68850.1 TetR family transcriptional regulator [Priestia filamentosa]RJS64446.1 TetR family transcriptional regulator [Priestia filamentosa]WCM17363.1 TetR/AcrR family transcriptional regulator [Priestia filamentosa]
MPKIVDHQKQREKIAAAAWEVIRTKGMEQASIRNIAKQSGFSVGSIRHYFPSQASLLTFAMNLVSERVNERIHSMSFEGEPFKVMKEFLLQFLPTTKEKEVEMEVWMAFIIKSLSDDSLKEASDEVYKGIKFGAASVIDALKKLKLLKDHLDEEYEVERLFALLDGLALHAVLQKTEFSTEKLERIIEQHLKSLCK